MKKNNLRYDLNFIIPAGPTGPQGPTGIQGEIGPTGPASLNTLMATTFYSSRNSGNLSIYRSVILPTNSIVFVPQNDEIEITEPGHYEFTVSGVFGGLTQNEILSISMTVTSENKGSYSVTLASIVADGKQDYFSQTMLLTFAEKQKIKVYLRKDDTFSSNVEGVTLLIKKLSF